MRRWQSRALLVTASIAAALALQACGGGGGGGGGGGPAPGGGGGQPFGLTQRVPVTGLTFPIGTPAQPGALTAVRAFPNLGFNQPLFLTHPPDGSNRIFVVEKAGRIFVFPNADSATTAQRSLFLDIATNVDPGGEQGLLGLAFDPLYATNGRFYVHYNPAGTPRRSRISRFNVSASSANQANAASESVILEVTQPANLSNHKGGMIAFGPDGMLYIALGDGGGGGDPLESGQDLGTLLGKLLRIDVRAGGTGYAVPSDNPFVGQSGARPEIWAYGLRNPWRFSFDRQTGTLWLGDVGQGAREEIDIIARGGNYGWDVFEGSLAFEPDGRPFSAFAAPVTDYDRNVGVSVTGGYVYRGTALTSVRGAYFYGDFGTGRLFALVRDPVSGAVLSNTQVATVNSLASFGEDQAGEVYAVSLGGSIFRFIENTGGPPPAPSFPQTLSATGLFTSTAALTPAPGLVEYELSSPLWSDGARKRRWIALPGTTQIVFHPTEAWLFPVGTVIVKHFEIETRVGDPTSIRRLETRVLVHESAGWAGYTYRWNPAQTDADLLPGATTTSETLTIVDASAPGGQRQQTYDYPSRTDCLRCHTQAAGHILGTRTRQLNRDFDYPSGVRDNQLRSFNNIALFTGDIGAATQYGALPDPASTQAPVAARARSYLDANCAQCHRPGGPTPVDIDLRFDTPSGSAQIVSVRPTAGDLGLVDAFRVKPGVKESSVLWERLRRLGATERMPPIATHVVDPTAVDVIGQWIDAGAP